MKDLHQKDYANSSIFNLLIISAHFRLKGIIQCLQVRINSVVRGDVKLTEGWIW